MEDSTMNNLNGVPNFGHGMPADGVVIAGVTDVGEAAVVEPTEVINPEETHEEEITESTNEDVLADESQEEEVNGE